MMAAGLHIHCFLSPTRPLQLVPARLLVGTSAGVASGTEAGGSFPPRPDLLSPAGLLGVLRGARPAAHSFRGQADPASPARICTLHAF